MMLGGSRLILQTEIRMFLGTIVLNLTFSRDIYPEMKKRGDMLWLTVWDTVLKDRDFSRGI